MAECPTPDALVEQRIDKVLTQYRESPKLLHLLRTYMRQVDDVVAKTCSIPEMFDLDTAVGDQLTLLGKRLGWPRCHCVCTVQPVFGFDCLSSGEYQITGFCDDNGTWLDCNPFGTSEICLTDDEVYRNFLRVRRYQMLSLYDLESLTTTIQVFFGLGATVMDSGNGRVVIAPGRALTNDETLLLQLYPRVLPVAPGIRVRFHFGTDPKVFGFGDGWGGFCELTEPDGLPLVTEDDDVITVEGGVELMTGPLTQDAPWMCEFDPKPYTCAT
ncbi:tail protein [Aminobacter phage Erebus]|nr:tail protein [Aminobacter phage Erebus]